MNGTIWMPPVNVKKNEAKMKGIRELIMENREF